MKTLSVIAFPGGFNLPVWTGMDRGFFEARGIAVDLSYTASSVEQLTALIDGRIEIGLTGYDNVVAYQEGQGEAETKNDPDLFAFMGGDNAFLRLVVRPEVRSYADLKGTTLSVDAMTTGFAFVLRKMLTVNGLRESDVSFDRAGGVLQRFEALKAGKHSGSLLITPFEMIGAKLGLNLLQNAMEVTGPYQGICGVARRTWAREHRQDLTAFIGGYLDALRWLFEQKNRSEACSILMARARMTPELADATCDVLLSANGGFDPVARLDPRGVGSVLQLRREYGRPRKALADARKYEDLSFYEDASRTT